MMQDLPWLSAAALSIVTVLRKSLVHMDISSDNIVIDKPFQHVREVIERALVGQGWQRVTNFGLGLAGAFGDKKAMQQLQQQVQHVT